MSITTNSELKTALANWLKTSTLTSRLPEFISLAEDRIAKNLRIRAMETMAELKGASTVAGGTAGGTANALTLTPATAATSYALGDAYSLTAAATNTSTATVNVSSLGNKDIKVREGNGTRGLVANEIVNGQKYRIYYDGTQFVLTPPGGIPLPDRFLSARRVYLEATRKKLDYFPPQTFWVRNAVNGSGNPEIYTIEGDFICLAPTGGGQIRMFYYKRFPDLSGDSDTNYILTYHAGLLLYGSLLEASIYLHDDLGAMRYARLFDDAIEAAEESDRKDRFPSGELTMRSEVSVV